MTDDEITEKWIRTAKEIGFSEAGVLNPETLKVMPLVRETCAEDKCHAYNHNWTCPPACGTFWCRRLVCCGGILIPEYTERQSSYIQNIWKFCGSRWWKYFLTCWCWEQEAAGSAQNVHIRNLVVSRKKRFLPWKLTDCLWRRYAGIMIWNITMDQERLLIRDVCCSESYWIT